MPFISRYKLSNSTSLGFGFEMSTGMVTVVPSESGIVRSSSSTTLETMGEVIRLQLVWRRVQRTDLRILFTQPSKECGDTLRR